MKRFFLSINVFLISLCMFFTTQNAYSFTAEYRGWKTFTEGEVQFLVPPDWNYTLNPEQGILVELKPDRSQGGRLFLYLNKSPVPSFIKVSPEEEEKYLREFAIIMRRFLERQGLSVALDSSRIITINNYKTYEIYYNISNYSGERGFARLDLLSVSNVNYGFMCLSKGDKQDSDRAVFGKIIKSIKIDVSKIPVNVGPKTYPEMLRSVRAALDVALQGMPPGWDWKLKSIDMVREEKSQDLLLQLALNREDTLLLTAGYALIVESLKTGTEPNTSKIMCNPNILSIFAQQLGMILGVAAGCAIGTETLPVAHVAIEVFDQHGIANYRYTVGISDFINAVRSNDPIKMGHATQITKLDAVYKKELQKDKLDLSGKKKEPVADRKHPVVQGNKWAVVVGISNYKDSRIPSLRYAHRDAKAFYDWLVSPEGGGYSPFRVKLLLEKDATAGEIRDALFNWLKQPIEEDMVTIFFAGHGSPPSPEEQDNLFLLPFDTDYDRISSTGFPMWDIETALKRFIKAKKVVIFADACHAGGIGFTYQQGRRSISVVPKAASALQALTRVGPGVAIITSADDRQFSQESKDWGGGHGIFTYYLLKGLKGEADFNTDGRVSLGELIPYLSENVRRSTKSAQAPTVSGRFDPELSLAK